MIGVKIVRFTAKSGGLSNSFVAVLYKYQSTWWWNALFSCDFRNDVCFCL